MEMYFQMMGWGPYVKIFNRGIERGETMDVFLQI